MRGRRGGMGAVAAGGVPGAMLLVLLVAALDAGPLAAQRVNGQLRDADTDAPIAGATLSLLDEQGAVADRAVSDSRGLFTLRGPRPGAYRIHASRLGYREARSAEVDLLAAAVLSVDLRLSAGAVVLDPLTVTGIPRYDVLDEGGFYERREHFGERLQSAVFLEQHDIERMNAFYVSDIFQNVPGVHASRGGIRMRGGCSPAIVINGFLAQPGRGRLARRSGSTMSMIARRVICSPRSLVGVEVYTGMAIPARFLADSGGCGVVMYWTK